MVHIQPLIAGFYLGYRSAKAQADNLSFYYTLFLAIFCYFTLIEVVLFLIAVAYVIDENYLADGLALIEEFGIISLLLIAVPFIIFHIFMIGLGLSGGIKFYERSKAANAKREEEQALKAQSQDGSPQDKTKPKNNTLSSILIIIISVLGLYYLLPVTPVEFGKARLADILQLAGRHEESLALRDELATGRPDDLKFLFYRGISHTLLDNHEAAIADYDRVIALKPDYAEAYHNRGVAKAKLGRFDAAIMDFTEAIRLNPKWAKAYRDRSSAYRQLGKTAQAKADCDKAQALSVSLINCF